MTEYTHDGEAIVVYIMCFCVFKHLAVLFLWLGQIYKTEQGNNEKKIKDIKKRN